MQAGMIMLLRMMITDHQYEYGGRMWRRKMKMMGFDTDDRDDNDGEDAYGG